MAKFICGIVFIICGLFGFVDKDNGFEAFFFSLEIIVGICLIYFSKG